MPEKRDKQPGDYILDRYMPDATPEEREEARENLRALVRVLLRITRRIVVESEESDSRESKRRDSL